MLLDVCLSPALIDQYLLDESIVVVTDIYRATTCMCVAFDRGVTGIRPVQQLDEALKLRTEQGFLTAGERGGQKAAGFDFGNSPFEFMDFPLAGRRLAMTTTNGTNAIHHAKRGSSILIGSFLNLSAVVDFCLQEAPGHLLILCSGWQNNISLEDTLFAGALVEKLSGYYHAHHDEPLLALNFWEQKKDHLPEAVSNFSHAQRLLKLGYEKDLEFCLKMDLTNVLPKYDPDQDLLIL